MRYSTNVKRWCFFVFICAISTQMIGCASIFKGSHSAVRVVAPAETEVFDESGQQLKQRWKGNGEFEVDLPCDRDHTLVFRNGDRQRTVNIKSRFQPAWLLPDALLGFPLAVDFLTQSWYDFDNVMLLIPPDDLEYTEMPYSGSPIELTPQQVALNEYLDEYGGRKSGKSLYLSSFTGWALGFGIPVVLAARNDVSFDNNLNLFALGLFITGPLGSASFMSLVDGGGAGSGDFSAGFGGTMLGAVMVSAGAFAVVTPIAYFSEEVALAAFFVTLAFVPPYLGKTAYERSRPQPSVLWKRSDYGFISDYGTKEGLVNSSLRSNFGQYAPLSDGIHLPIISLRF